LETRKKFGYWSVNSSICGNKTWHN
jgi:hypothetical protein